MNYTIEPVARVIALLVFASAVILPAYGQGGSSPRGARPDPLQRELQRELERDIMRRQLEARPSSPIERDGRLALAQITEDFLQIQRVNNDLMRAVSRSGALDLKFVAQAASDIRKRAERLKHNLALTEPEKRPKRSHIEVAAEVEQLKLSLSVLRGLIVRFVNNPVLKEANVVDAQLSAKARGDLEEIIEVSDEIRKSSERLNKGAQKSH